MESVVRVKAGELKVGDKIGVRVGRTEMWGRVTRLANGRVFAENTRATFSALADEEVQAKPLDRNVPEALEDLLKVDKGWSGYDLQVIEGTRWTPENPGRERWFFRYGAPPASGCSRNHLTGELEPGVSVYVTPVPTSIIDTSRPLYALRGRPIGLGSDDEPVIEITGEVRLIGETVL